MDTEREGAAIEMTQQEADEKNTAENREDSIRREYGFAPDVKLKECRFCCVMIPKKAKIIIWIFAGIPRRLCGSPNRTMFPV